jgi:hypothetical protein
MYYFYNSLIKLINLMESLQVRKMINKPNPFGLGMLQRQSIGRVCREGQPTASVR